MTYARPQPVACAASSSPEVFSDPQSPAAPKRPQRVLGAERQTHEAAKLNACAVRIAQPRDAAAMRPLWQAMMNEHADSHDAFALNADAGQIWQRATVELMGRHDGFVLAAQRGDSVVGYCSGWVAHNPPIYEVHTVGLISELVVKAGVRQRGVGQALLDGAKAWFAERELSEFQLSVAVHNEVGRNFWRRHGGEPVLMRYRFAMPEASGALPCAVSAD